MSNWHEDNGSIHFGDGTWIRLDNKLKAQQIVAKFSATVDALAAELEAVKGTDHYQHSLDEMHLRYNVEAELDALAAELARVKAESLRVVKVGGIRAFMFVCEDQCEYVMWNGKVCKIDSMQEGLDVVGENRNYPIANGIGVQPVRLKRWEDSNE